MENIEDKLFLRVAQNHISKYRMSALSICVLLLTFSACSSFRQHVKSDEPSNLKDIDNLAEADSSKFTSAKPVLRWWYNFDDSLLHSLIEEALKKNLDIKVAIANLFEARGILRETKFDRFPTVTSNASYARERLSEEGIFGQVAESSFNNYNSGFDAFWELDIFGRVSERIAAQKSIADAALNDLQFVHITIAAETARTYAELRGAQLRLGIAMRNVKNQQKTFELTKKLSVGGRSTDLDVARASSQLNLSTATIPPMKAEINAAINRLAVLTGKVPNGLKSDLRDTKPLPSLPKSVAVGNAKNLIKRRPDIQGAEHRLSAAISQYNVAVTDLFPVVTINGTLGFSSTSLASFGSSAVAGAIGPSISWAAFNLGRVRAQIAQRDARANSELARYEKTVLQALEEVQNALVNYSREDERRVTLANAAKASVKAGKLARMRFDAGLDTFLDLLDTERRQLEAEDALAVSETTTVLNLIAIYKALGGGWKV